MDESVRNFIVEGRTDIKKNYPDQLEKTTKPLADFALKFHWS